MKGLVVRLSPENNKSEGVNGERSEIAIWRPDKIGLEKVWESMPFSVERPDLRLFERVSSSLLTQDNLFLGLNTGVIKKIGLMTSTTESFDRFEVQKKFKKWDLYGSRKDFQDHLQFVRAKRRYAARGDKETSESLNKTKTTERIPNYFGFHLLHAGFREISSIIENNGEIYDGSAAGIFKTNDSQQTPLLKEWVTSLVIYNGRLCYVPLGRNHFLDELEFGRNRESEEIKRKGGCLVDALSGEIVFEKLTPFDGSGGRQAEYHLSGDTAYVHHGDWPYEKIRIQDIKTGKIIKEVIIRTSAGFVEYNGEVFDSRMEDDRTFWFMRSDEEDNEKNLLFEVGAYDSVASHPDLGILVARYDSDKDRTTVISHLRPKEIIFGYEGFMRLMK